MNAGLSNAHLLYIPEALTPSFRFRLTPMFRTFAPPNVPAVLGVFTKHNQGRKLFLKYSLRWVLGENT